MGRSPPSNPKCLYSPSPPPPLIPLKASKTGDGDAQEDTDMQANDKNDLEAGDRVLSIDGQPAAALTHFEMQDMVNLLGDSFEMVVLRLPVKRKEAIFVDLHLQKSSAKKKRRQKFRAKGEVRVEASWENCTCGVVLLTAPCTEPKEPAVVWVAVYEQNAAQPAGRVSGRRKQPQATHCLIALQSS